MKVTLNLNRQIQYAKENFVSKVLRKKAKNISLPIISTPIIVYNLKATRDTNNTINCRKAIEKQQELLNKKEITQQEYNKNVAEIKKYYESADKLPENISSQTIKQKEPTFKGTEENVVTENGITNDVSDVPELSPRELELAEIDNIDVSLPSDLQEYLVAPLKKAGEGLLDNIMDLSDAALETSDKIFSTIKNFLSDAVDMF